MEVLFFPGWSFLFSASVGFFQKQYMISASQPYDSYLFQYAAE